MRLTLVWSGIGSAIIYKVVDLTIGLRPKYESERAGLDLTEHGERAYNDLLVCFTTDVQRLRGTTG